MTLYTAGYVNTARTKVDMGTFLSMLQGRGIDRLVDIRDNPFSYKEGFSKRALEEHLRHAGIAYTHIRQLGAPKPMRKRFGEDGDWGRFSGAFLEHLEGQPEALDQLEGLARASKCVLLCACADVHQCHRSLVAEVMGRRGMAIEHLSPDRMAGAVEHAQDDLAPRESRRGHGTIRREFWARMIRTMRDAGSDQHWEEYPRDERYLLARSGIRGVDWFFTIHEKGVRVELYFELRYGEKERNRALYDALRAQKDRIGEDFGSELLLEWKNFPGKQSRKICAHIPGDASDQGQWDALIEAAADGMLRLERSLRERLDAAHQRAGERMRRG